MPLNGWIAILVLVAWFAVTTAPQTTQPQTNAPSTQPAAATSQPAATQMPRDAEYLKELIRETDRQPPAPPKGAVPSNSTGSPQSGTLIRGGSASMSDRGETMFAEGTMIVERTGRVNRVAEEIEFSLNRDDGKGVLRFTLLPCQLLEELERDLTVGVGQAVVTGEITRYKNRAYLLLRTYRRQADRGNLSP